MARSYKVFMLASRVKSCTQEALTSYAMTAVDAWCFLPHCWYWILLFLTTKHNVLFFLTLTEMAFSSLFSVWRFVNAAFLCIWALLSSLFHSQFLLMADCLSQIPKLNSHLSNSHEETNLLCKPLVLVCLFVAFEAESHTGNRLARNSSCPQADLLDYPASVSPMLCVNTCTTMCSYFVNS